MTNDRILAAAKIARSTIVDQWDAFVKALEDKPEGGTFFEDKYGVLRDKPEEYELPASYKKPEAREPEMPRSEDWQAVVRIGQAPDAGDKRVRDFARRMASGELVAVDAEKAHDVCSAHLGLALAGRKLAAERQRDEYRTLLERWKLVAEVHLNRNSDLMRDTRAALSASREGNLSGQEREDHADFCRRRDDDDGPCPHEREGAK